MEVETGKVKAIVNLNRDGEQAWESYNHAIGTRTEPGSTMKMASVIHFYGRWDSEARDNAAGV